MAADPRVPVWIGRAVAAIVVGAAATFWLSWRLGVTFAALVAIADVIFRSRTSPIIPASARVTSAQRRSRRRLARLRANGYVTLNARAIPNTKEVIDHLVVGPAGVFALDSERWDRRLPVRAIQGSQLYHGPFSQRDRLEHARWEAAQASRLLGNAVKRKIDVHPTMVIYGPKIPWNVVSLYGVDVFSGNRLRKYFRQQAKARRAVQLDAGQISLIQEAAERVLPPVAG
jgi:Nuclease-related domain